VRKVLFVSFMVMAFVALGSLAIFAGGKECTADKATDAKAASSTTTTKACCASKAGTTSASATKIDATMASSKTTGAGAACPMGDKVACTAADKAACAAKLTGITTASACSIESCLKECEAKHAEVCGAEASKHHLTAMSIKGMTCAGCENNVKTTLMAVEGVNSVIEVCHKAGFAVVCVKEGVKINNESMIKAVSAKGFESQIIPAVSVTTTTTNTTEKAECEAHKKDGAK